MIKPHDHHEGAVEFRIFGGGAIARRLAQIEIEGEQRRQQIVLKAARPWRGTSRGRCAGSSRSRKVWCGLSEEATKWRARINSPSRGLDSDRLALFDHDPLRLGHQPDLAAAASHRGFERARQGGRAAARHLRLGRARQQRRDMMPESAQPQVDLAQAVEEQQPGLDRRVLEFPCDEFQRRAVRWPQAGAGRRRCARAGGAAPPAAAAGNDLPSARMFSTIGTKSSCQRRSVAASFALNRAKEATVRSKSVHHWSARPSLGQQHDIELRLDDSPLRGGRDRDRRTTASP